jgi:hypothetical protein
MKKELDSRKERPKKIKVVPGGKSLSGLFSPTITLYLKYKKPPAD